MMAIAQHFLLSAQARTLSLKEIYKGGEEKAYETFRKVRWHATDGAPVCPRCGGLDAYEITTRRRFKCKVSGVHAPLGSRVLRSTGFCEARPFWRGGRDVGAIGGGWTGR